VGPSTLFDSLLYQIEGVPNGTDISVVGRRRVIGIGVLREQHLVFLAWIADGIVVLSLLSIHPLLRVHG
jgi:hypothetical protein